MKKKFRNICIAGLVGCSLLIGSSVLYTQLQSMAEETNIVSIQAEYDQNQEFVIPSYKMTVDGQTVAANGILLFPDGTARYGDKIVLNLAGRYTLRYTASVNGKVRAEEFTFIVQQDTVSSKNGSIVEYGEFIYNGETKAVGLQVNLARNDTITFNQLIDVENLTAKDILLEGFATPQSVGTADMDKLTFTFTDSENPDIYLTVSNRRYANETIVGHSYYLAGGNGQSMTGLEASSQKVHVDNIYGTWSNHGYTGESYSYSTHTSSVVSPSEYPFRVSLDTSTMEVYGDTGFIIDLNSTEYFERLWNGFPSGKARLSISASGFNTLTADFFITNVRGLDLSQDKCPDQEAPIISVNDDCLDAEGNMPLATVGAKYKIPEAKANDFINGDCEVRVSVWYDYAGANASKVNVSNGEFAVSRLGLYTIVYTAQDYMGNTETQALAVNTVFALEELQLTLPAEVPHSAVLGEDMTIPALAEVVGGSGNKKIRVFAKSETDLIEIENGTVSFEKEGTYEIVYEATDYLGNVASASFEIAVTRGDKPILKEEVLLPQLYLSGFEYVLPEIYVNDYTNGSLVRRLCEVAVTDANGENIYMAGESFKPFVNQNKDTIEIAYRYDGVVYYEKNIPVVKTVNDDGVILENYFYGEGFTAEKTESGMLISAIEGGARFTWEFANDLLAEAFSLEFENVSTSTEFQSITLVLADVQNPEIAISVHIALKNGATYVGVGETSYEIEYDFTKTLSEGHSNLLSIRYSKQSIAFGTTEIDVTETNTGEPFVGFPSGKVRVTCLTEGIQGAAAYKVVSINEHKFVYTTRDRVSPQLLITDVYGGSYVLNDTYAIPTVMVSDVLCPTTEVKMTVMHNGSLVKDVDGLTLSEVSPDRVYKILLADYGTYEITYVYKEIGSSRENDNQFDYVVNVEDREDPTIMFRQNFQTTVKVGEYLILPDYTVQDNKTASENLIVIKQVLNPNGGIVKISGNSIQCKYAGVYKVQILVMDEAGNICIHTANITVTE